MSRRSERRRARVVLAVLAAALALAAAGTASTAQDAPRAAVVLGFGIGTPGKTFLVPLALEHIGDLEIHRVVARLRVPPELSFARLEKAALMEDVEGFRASARLVDEHGAPVQPKEPAAAEAGHAKNGPPTFVEIVVDSAKTPLEDGTLTYAVFRLGAWVTADATPEVGLTTEGSLYGADASRALASATSEAKVIVESLDAPISACFFYMH